MALNYREELKVLIAQRDLLELEAEAISSELLSTGPNGEPPAGIKGNLVDSEGFPRGDIDIYSVRNKRNRLNVINTGKVDSLIF
jgi:26S proteasome non-ATPase regulatory subunit 9